MEFSINARSTIIEKNIQRVKDSLEPLQKDNGEWLGSTHISSSLEKCWVIDTGIGIVIGVGTLVSLAHWDKKTDLTAPDIRLQEREPGCEFINYLLRENQPLSWHNQGHNKDHLVDICSLAPFFHLNIRLGEYQPCPRPDPGLVVAVPCFGGPWAWFTNSVFYGGCFSPWFQLFSWCPTNFSLSAQSVAIGLRQINPSLLCHSYNLCNTQITVQQELRGRDPWNIIVPSMWHWQSWWDCLTRQTWFSKKFHVISKNPSLIKCLYFSLSGASALRALALSESIC